MEKPRKANSPVLYATLLVMFLLLIALLGWRAANRMMGMSSASAASATDTQLWKPGDAVKLVIEITRAEETTVSGKLLVRKDDTRYARTGNSIAITLDHNTKVVMGKAADIHAGAVVHVTGTWDADGRVHGSQIVILSGYVQVE